MRWWLLPVLLAFGIACGPTVVGSRPPTSAADARDETLEELEEMLRRDPSLALLMEDAPRRRIQALVAVPETEEGKGTLRRFGYRVDAEYFYPASAIKLTVALAAAQKLEELRASSTTPLRVVEREGARVRTLDTTLGDEIERALVVSDNEASNRLFELVGRDELADRVAGFGLRSSRIVHRLGEASERKSYAFELVPDGKTPVVIAQRVGFVGPAPSLADGPFLGSSYVDDAGRLVAGPMSFAEKNRMSLRDLQDVLIAVMRPELLDGVDLRIGPEMRSEIVATLGLLPSASRRASYPRSLDDANKPLASVVAAALPNDRVRVYGKGGRAYGFTVECSYLVDETTHRSAFVTAVVYANDNGRLNDDQYEYDAIADPFIAGLGKQVARSFLAATASSDD